MDRKIEKIETNFEEIIANIDTYINKFIDQSIFGFKKLYPSDEQQLEILSLFGDRLNWVPNSENKIAFRYTEDHSRILEERSHCGPDDIIIDWHLEHIDYEFAQIAAAWNMKHFTCDKTCGKTGFVDVSEIFNDMPADWKEFLSKCKIINYNEYIEGVGHICVFPNGKLFHAYVRDALLVHPRKGITVPRLDTRGVVNTEFQRLWLVEDRKPTEEEFSLFDSIVDFYTSEVWNNHDRQMWWLWDEGDLLINDIFMLAHGVTGGFANGERSFLGMWGFPNVKEVIDGTRPFITV